MLVVAGRLIVDKRFGPFLCSSDWLSWLHVNTSIIISSLTAHSHTCTYNCYLSHRRLVGDIKFPVYADVCLSVCLCLSVLRNCQIGLAEMLHRDDGQFGTLGPLSRSLVVIAQGSRQGSRKYGFLRSTVLVFGIHYFISVHQMAAQQH